VIWTNPAEAALSELSNVPWVRFRRPGPEFDLFSGRSVCGDPSFLAITESADPVRRKRMARRAH